MCVRAPINRRRIEIIGVTMKNIFKIYIGRCATNENTREIDTR